ncbi:MAG TPA: peptide-methionine (S)-S-oxide reductase MsrA [Thermoanaerobaculia bacterium]|jgi:peptide-methionine (S)-S-oxide reductase|nr:peptide-methionine (S)-S-oxide reductase MsrA [Thermoanaerobaculia bacterium]
MRSKLLVTIAGAALAAGFLARSSSADAIDKVIPAPAVDAPVAPAKHTEVAVLAGGCFWGMQGMFEHVDGVTKVVAGYSGGDKATATYDQVTTERTGHAEAVEITFDPAKVSYGQLLRLYFSVAHDPTELDRQGPDSGSSYRSQIFFASPAQERVARAYITQLGKAAIFDDPIVTKVEPLKAFYAAEGYHQDFLIHNPTHPYIVRNDLPKVAALKRLYPQMYRDQPVTVTR